MAVGMAGTVGGITARIPVGGMQAPVMQVRHIQVLAILAGRIRAATPLAGILLWAGIAVPVVLILPAMWQHRI